MKTRAWLTLALCGLVAAPAAVPAQEPAAGGEVVLQFKHQPGKARKFRLGLNSNMTMTPLGQAGGVGSLPMVVKSLGYFTEKVQSVQGDSAALVVSPLSMTMDTSAFGMSILLKMENGKFTMNGQEIPADGPLGPLAAMLSSKPVEVHRNGRGEVTMPADATGLTQLLNSSLLVQLPEGAVKPGDTWETTAKGQGQLPLGGALGGAPGGALPAVELKLKHTLKALEKQAGRTIAVIETAGGAALGEGQGEGSQKFSGTTRFDVAEGAIKSATYKADVKMKLKLPAALGGAVPGAAPDAGNPAEGGADAGAMQIDGVVAMDLSEVLPTAAKPAAKPTAKKPVRKSTKRR